MKEKKNVAIGNICDLHYLTYPLHYAELINPSVINLYFIRLAYHVSLKCDRALIHTFIKLTIKTSINLTRFGQKAL